MSGSPTTPLLSLCLATYNRAGYLDRYLTHHLSAFEAAGVDYELVVSDNCSTDETPEILARYASRYPRMWVSRQPRNVGAYPNILTTLHQSRGEVTGAAMRPQDFSCDVVVTMDRFPTFPAGSA